MKQEEFEQLLTKLTNLVSLVEGREYELKLILVEGRLKYRSFLVEEMRSDIKIQYVIDSYMPEDMMDHKIIPWGETIEDLPKVIESHSYLYPYLEMLIEMLLRNVSDSSIYSYLKIIIERKNKEDDEELKKLTNKIVEYQKILDFILTTTLEESEKAMIVKNANDTIDKIKERKEEIKKRKAKRREKMLTDKELLHIASLSKLDISNDLDFYKKEVNAIYEDINKINRMEDLETDILISPCDNKNMASIDEVEEMINIDTIKENVPHLDGNFIEVVNNNHD